jgi:hypothetical protein
MVASLLRRAMGQVRFVLDMVAVETICVSARLPLNVPRHGDRTCDKDLSSVRLTKRGSFAKAAWKLLFS